MKQTTADKINRLRETKKGYLQYVMTVFGVDRKQAFEVADAAYNGDLAAYNELPVQAAVIDNQAETDPDSGLVFTERYTYNPVLDQYIVPLKSYGGNYICKGEQHRGMQLSYGRYGKESIDEICHTYEMDRSWFMEYKTIMGWTKTMLPISKEEVLTKDLKDNLKTLTARRMAKLQQAANREDWGRIQGDAKRWQQFLSDELLPFESFLKKFQPKALQPMNFNRVKGKVESNRVFLVGLSDLHFGAKADGNELFHGRDFNAEVIEQIVDNYAQQIAADVADRTYSFEKAVVCLLGDILHSLNGRTEKGTPLEYDCLREEQFELAFNTLIRFIQRMIEIFGKVEAHCVKGNHAGPDDYILCLALKSFFRNDKRVVFNLYRSRSALFRVSNSVILIDHGDSDMVAAKVPTSGPAREAYIQARFMQKPELLQGATSRLMIQGDQHHYEYREFKGFEFFMFGSPSQDRYADHMNLYSKPRQNCLIIDGHGVKEQLHYYFN